MIFRNHTQGDRVHVVATIVVSGVATQPNPVTLTTFHPVRPRYLNSLLNYDSSCPKETYTPTNNPSYKESWQYAIAAHDINGM